MDPAQTNELLDKLSAAYPKLLFSRSAEFTESLPDMEQMREMVYSLFAMTVLVGSIVLMNTMIMSVYERTREIGLRMALGAGGPRVRGMVLRQVGWMMLIGGGIGILAALALGRGAQSLLFEMGGNDPFVVVLAAVVLSGVALGAGYLPALRASKVDPMQALRYE